MPSNSKRSKQLIGSNEKLSHEKFLADYSFSIALAFIPFIEIIRSFLLTNDPEEALFYQNFIIVSYLILLFPLMLRVIAIFIPVINEKHIALFLSKTQINSFESYKISKNSSLYSDEQQIKAHHILYFTATNNIMWFIYYLILFFVMTTILWYFLFDARSLFVSFVPSAIIFILKIVKLIAKSKRPNQ